MSNKPRFILGILFSILVIVACTPTAVETDCKLRALEGLTVYRFPNETSDVFGTLLFTEEFKVLARTSEGWLGFDPGIAQAGWIGLAHHRWVRDPLPITPSCVDSVDLVTMEEILVDYEASTDS